MQGRFIGKKRELRGQSRLSLFWRSPRRLGQAILPSALNLLAAAAIALTSGCGEPAVHRREVQKPLGDSFLILISFGHGQPPQEQWAGFFTAVNGVHISEAKGWLFKSYDHLLVNRFDVRTLDAEKRTSELKGIMLRGSSDPTGQITVETNRGSFSISVSDLGAEKELEFLEARVRVRVTRSPPARWPGRRRGARWLPS